MHQYNWHHFVIYKAIMLCKGYGTKAHRRIKWKQGLVSFTNINKSSRSPCDLDHKQIDLKINRDHLHPEINICAKFGDPSLFCVKLSSGQGLVTKGQVQGYPVTLTLQRLI